MCFKWSLAQQVTTEEAIAVAKTELLYTKGLSVEITDVTTFDSNGHTLRFNLGNNEKIYGKIRLYPPVEI